jgi:uncharacterized protein YdiU (UPF0061 family)
MRTLSFDNRFVNLLPGDAEHSLRRRQVLNACWSPATPTPVAAPQVIAHSREVADNIGFTTADVESEWFAEVFGGNRVMQGMVPYAACYGGHQFGNWAGQLGDGRAISLGEVIGADGARHELQLKGAGPTPYSRTADGRAVLRSSLREFLCSEAMHHLGVPTTRALSLVLTGDQVVRDMLYDGHPREEPGAIVCRVAPSFIRFGNFEILAARDDRALLAQLVDFTIARDFPHLEGDTAAKRAAWFTEVCERTAHMIVHWMRVGFVHGVMNTDNMSIMGLTIDYGPYGWLDNFDPQWTPNTTDAAGRRYRFGQQPAIAQWNLIRLAEALLPVFPDEQALNAGLDRFATVYAERYAEMNQAKFGLLDPQAGDDEIIRDGFALLFNAEMDFTRFFRALGRMPRVLPPDRSASGLLGDVFYDATKAAAREDELRAWLSRWHERVSHGSSDPVRRERAMRAVNPSIILRNYLSQQAIDAAEQGDFSGIGALLTALRTPYDDGAATSPFDALRPEWARHKAGCSMLSCSS